MKRNPFSYLSSWVVLVALSGLTLAFPRLTSAESVSGALPMDGLFFSVAGSPFTSLFSDTQRGGLAQTFGLSGPESSLAIDGIESVYHAKGSKADGLTLENAASWLERSQGHGAYFEQQVAKDFSQKGENVHFVKAGNEGTDLRVFPNKGNPMTFVQVKATANSLKSAREGLVDALTFAGGGTTRPDELLNGEKSFISVIPKDQYNQLIQKGDLLSGGHPSPSLIDRVLKEAGKRAVGNGPEAIRLRASLPKAPDLLGKMTVKPGPLSYDELLLASKNSAKAIRGASLAKAGKVLTVVALVASPIQAYDGVKEIQQGESVKGTLNLAGSAANATSAVAGLAGRGLLSGGAGAVGAGVYGAIDIYTGVKNKDAEKISVGGVKSAAAIAMGVGTATGQPEVVIPAAIVYGGAVATDVVYENREAIGETLYVASESAKESAANGYKKSKQCLSNTTDLTVEACARATESIRGSLNETAMVAYDYTPECIKNNRLFQKSVGWFHGF